MKDNKYLAWTSFVLFLLSIGMTLLFMVLAAVSADFIENPGVVIAIVGVFSLIAMIMGFLTFKFPQAKAGAIGGLILLLLVLFITPIGSTTTVIPPQPETGSQGQTVRTGIAEVDAVIDTVIFGSPQEQLGLIQFSSLPCTRAEGFGGPPKCAEGEAEGTIVEALPILGSEGHHTRRSEMEGWKGIPASEVYAVYRVSDRVYSDEAYPAGEYAIVFLLEEGEPAVTTQITDGKIVRLDYLFANLSEIDLEQVASEIILAPQR